MSILVSTSTNIDDYEILIRKRGEGKYASYCPQLNIMLTGYEHVEVQNKMLDHIENHIKDMKISQN
ncbi:MAG: hypothetical protein ACOVNU_10150 [Candidatus Kapaibacteriota bacterium]|jgi:hypothetical protein